MTADERTSSFGYWVRRRRQALDITQAALAEEVGCATVTITKIERDERRPSVQMANLLANRLVIPDNEREQFVAAARGRMAVHRLPLSTEPTERLEEETVAGPRLDIPSLIGPYIERTAVLAALVALLGTDTTRLVTLLGTGGSGKTHLAIRAAQEVVHRFSDGVSFVALESVARTEDVLPALAGAQGVMDYGGATLQETLLAALQYKQRLLVLDNFEHLLGAAPLVATILETCPRVVVLVTSREPLHLRVERLYPIPPLGMPAEADVTVAEVANSEAAQLFALRAQAIQPDFVLDDKTAAPVAAICRHLDGLPLAIELAAARLALFSLSSLARELLQGESSSLDLLQSTLGDVPVRQRSLRATLAWSVGLLSDEEQALFCQLGVFSGGFTLDAAQAVARSVHTSHRHEVRSSTLDLIDGLVSKQLVCAGAEGETRFWLRGAVREFSRELLAESGQYDETRLAHARWYARLAQEAEEKLFGPDQVKWLDRLNTEKPNLHGAAAWAIEAGEADLAAAFGATLFPFWRWRGYLAEARRLLEEMVPLAADSSSKSLRAKVLLSAGMVSSLTGDFESAEERLRECMEIAAACRCRWAEAYAKYYLAVVCRFTGRIEEGLHFNLEAVHLSEAHALQWVHARALTGLGQHYRLYGPSDKALATIEVGLDIFRQLQDAWGIAFASIKIANVLTDQQRYVEAESYAREALHFNRLMGDTMGMSLSLTALGWLARSEQQYDQAVRYLQQSLRLRWELGDRHGVASNLASYAHVELLREEPELALTFALVAKRMLHAIDGRLYAERTDLAEIIASAQDLLDEETLAAVRVSAEMHNLERQVSELLK
ncbi:MAG: ATP-binding protein [Caldilineaceae bacterium]